MHGLSTKGRYATRLLVYLARRREDGPLKKQEIAKAEGITPDYVEQILIRLKAAGFVKSYRGKTGGFSLAADADTLTVASVLEVMEGRMAVVPCLIGEPCNREASCSTRGLWSRADQALKQVFTSATIGDLARGAPQEAEFTI